MNNSLFKKIIIVNVLVLVLFSLFIVLEVAPFFKEFTREKEKLTTRQIKQEINKEEKSEAVKEQETTKEINKEDKKAEITVDYNDNLGEFSPYVFGTLSSPFVDKSGFFAAKEAGFKMIEISMSVKMPSDPEDLSQYDFTKLDQQVSAAIEYGVEPMIWFSQNKTKPEDIDGFSAFTKNILKHLTKEENNGHNWNIKVLRFGNEPDNAAFWSGTKEDFFTYYSAWAKAAKSVDENFILIAPSLMIIKDNGNIASWATEFLKYNKDNDVPLDVFSFHAYSPFIYEDFYDDFKTIKSELKKYPTLSPIYGVPKLANDEWNIMVGDAWSGSYHNQFDTAWVAAQNVMALIGMIEGGDLFLSVRYGGMFNDKKGGNFGGCHDFPLVDCDKKGKLAYYAMKAFNQFVGKTRILTKGSDFVNLGAIAGKSNKEIITIISNFDIDKYISEYPQPSKSPVSKQIDSYVSKFGNLKTYNEYKLELNNLPWGSSDELIYERYVVDEEKKLELVETKILSGNSTLSFIIEKVFAPSVQLIKVYKN